MANGALHALALLLLLAAGAKLVTPARSAVALRQAGLPSTPWLVRLLAAVEVGVAVSVLLLGGPLPALALAALHLGFAAFITRLRATAAGASCGCFGSAEAPADRLHVGVNLAAAGVAAAAAVTGPATLPGTLVAQPGFGLPYLVLVAVTAQALLLVLTALPDLLAADRRLA